MDHSWPAPGEHLWGPWSWKRGISTAGPPIRKRSCVHPLCDEVEEQEVSRGMGAE